MTKFTAGLFMIFVGLAAAALYRGIVENSPEAAPALAPEPAPAEDFLEKINPTADLSAKDFLARGEDFLARGDAVLAAGYFARVPEDSPFWQEALFGQIRAAIARNDAKSGEIFLSKFRENFPNDPRAGVLGLRLAILGADPELEKARVLLLKNSGDLGPEAVWLLAARSAADGDAPGARFWLGKSTGSAPDFGKKMAALGAALDRADDARDAPAAYRGALVGAALLSAGEPVLAGRAAEKSLAESPDYRDAWLILAESRIARRNFSGATDAISQADGIDPISPRAAFLRGVLDFEDKKFTQAATDFEAAELYGFTPVLIARERRAAALFAAGEFEKADKIFIQIAGEKSLPAAAFFDWIEWRLADPARDPRAAAAKILAADPADPERIALFAIAVGPGATDFLSQNLPAGHPGILLARALENLTDPEIFDRLREVANLDPTGFWGRMAVKKWAELRAEK